MDAALFHGAFNPVIAEARDAGHGLFDPKTGDTIVQGRKGMAIFIGVMSFAVKAVMAKAATHGGPREGDVYIMNDPYVSGTHLNDFKMVRPVFSQGELVCYVASAGHWTDVGGNIAGNFNAVATETFQEGVLVPAVRVMRGGELQDDVVDMLTSISRMPRNCLGDLHAQLNAVALGAERLQVLAVEFGGDALRAAFRELHHRAAQLARAAIADLPDGTYSFDDELDEDAKEHRPIKVAVDVTVLGDKLTLDFSRTSRAVLGPQNASYPTTVASCYVAIKHLFPEIFANGGCLDPVHIVVPPDSMLNATRPMPLSGYVETSGRIVDVIFGAIAKAAPQLTNGLPHGTINALSMAGTRTNGESWVMFLFFGGGLGGNPQGDGLNNGGSPIGSALIAPAEIIEARYPVLFHKWALRPDSGGAGQYRGGLGALYEIELLADWATYSHFGERAESTPSGVAGGMPALGNEVSIRQEAVWEPLKTGAKAAGIPLAKGSRVRLETPGGGGFGSPQGRTAESIQRDLKLGYVSIDAAKHDYPQANLQ
ncbi:MAG: hydantoinase B/oxoprolinase family protein [Pseudomonadota bacterium]|nr:hydantoinase B/oxoprolinase family protein [Pseudomonadota bacterium]